MRTEETLDGKYPINKIQDYEKRIDCALMLDKIKLKFIIWYIDKF